MEKRYLPTGSEGRKEGNPQPGSKRWLWFRAVAASQTDTAINENILLARSAFPTGNYKDLFCTVTATDFVGGQESIC